MKTCRAENSLPPPNVHCSEEVQKLTAAKTRRSSAIQSYSKVKINMEYIYYVV